MKYLMFKKNKWLFISISISISLCFSFLGFGSMTFASDILSETGKNNSSETLLPGQCRPIITSKKYLNSNFLNENIQSEKNKIFSCEYECLTADEQLEKVLAISEVIILNEQDEGRDMVCDGLIMNYKKTEYASFYEPESIQPFWSQLSKRAELRRWGKNNQTTMTERVFQEAYLKGIETLKDVAFEYLKNANVLKNDLTNQGDQSVLSSNQIMANRLVNAAIQLLEIYQQTPDGKIILQQVFQGNPSDILVSGPVKAHLYFFIF